MAKDDFCRAHTEYVSEVAKLMVWHIWDLDRQGAMPITQGLSRLTTRNNGSQPHAEGFDNPAWAAMKARLVERMNACKDGPATHAMEQDCLEMLWPYLEPRIQEDSRPTERPFHCWSYGMKDDNTVVSVHIGNADKPKSPFADVQRFAIDLLRAIQDACAAHPKCHTVMCNSWLNSVPKFLELWPQSFLDNRTNWQDTGGFGPGRWGQYMRADGGFNHKAGATMRETGKHPYPKSSGRCPVSDAVSHLRSATGRSWWTTVLRSSTVRTPTRPAAPRLVGTSSAPSGPANGMAR